MKLQYFKGHRSNFGDDLNEWLWPQLIPDFLDDDSRTLFLGIGSIIGEQYPPSAKKIVVGTGYVPAYHSKVPNVHDGNWDIAFVRGPRTARALSIPVSLGIGDAAILLRALDINFHREPRFVGFMPHWESMQRGDWKAACKLAGIRLIDPTAPVETILKEILGCKVLITEAMHGAIVADALRVPWIPLLPIDHAHREKWFDWADALNIQLIRHRLWPSNPAELMRSAIYRPFLSRIAGCLEVQPVSRLAQPLMTYAAAKRLSSLSKETPSLSADGALDTALYHMLDKLRQIEKRYGK